MVLFDGMVTHSEQLESVGWIYQNYLVAIKGKVIYMHVTKQNCMASIRNNLHIHTL